MYPKDFRKIYHPEPKILTSLVNCAQTVRAKCRADPTSSGSAKNVFIMVGFGQFLPYSDLFGIKIKCSSWKIQWQSQISHLEQSKSKPNQTKPKQKKAMFLANF